MPVSSQFSETRQKLYFTVIVSDSEIKFFNIDLNMLIASFFERALISRELNVVDTLYCFIIVFFRIDSETFCR